MTFILLIAVIVLIIVLISNKNKFQKTINDLQNIINSLNAKIKSFEQERENLSEENIVHEKIIFGFRTFSLDENLCNNEHITELCEA